MIIKKRSVVLLLCTLTSMLSVMLGTVAFMTDRATVTNRFTIGHVDIVVDETKVDENGNPVPNENQDPDNPDDDYLRTDQNGDVNYYPLIPGIGYTKDPTMTIRAGSEESYVRMMVTIAKAAEIDAIFAELKSYYPEKYADGFVPEQHVTGWDSTEWNFVGMTMDDGFYTLEFRYKETVTAGDTDKKLPSLFKTITIPGELTSTHLTQLEGFYIDIVGHAIQKAGFESADVAWAAFDAQMSAEGSGAAQP